MKNKWIVVPVCLALGIFASCSKNDSDNPSTPPPVEVDSSKCLLAEVKYEFHQNLPYYFDKVTIGYDSLKRINYTVATAGISNYIYESGKITQRTYLQSVADSNLVNRFVYTLDNTGRIVSRMNYVYNRPKSESDYWAQSRMDYEYDGEGYLIGMKSYFNGTTIQEEDKLIYQNGNLVQRENTFYNGLNSSGKLGTDTITYTYDNTAWFPEAAYLYEIDPLNTLRTGKPNKNNVVGIQCKMYQSGSFITDFKSIQYAYTVKGSKPEKVTMTATTTKGNTVNTTINFGYNCD